MRNISPTGLRSQDVLGVHFLTLSPLHLTLGSVLRYIETAVLWARLTQRLGDLLPWKVTLWHTRDLSLELYGHPLPQNVILMSSRAELQQHRSFMEQTFGFTSSAKTGSHPCWRTLILNMFTDTSETYYTWLTLQAAPSVCLKPLGEPRVVAQSIGVYQRVSPLVR